MEIELEKGGNGEGKGEEEEEEEEGEEEKGGVFEGETGGREGDRKGKGVIYSTNLPLTNHPSLPSLVRRT